MPISRKALCLAYALVAVLALVGTWGNNLTYLSQPNGYWTFWQDTLVNSASRSITVDVFFLGFAVFVWMVLEARRLGMRWVWLYFVGGMVIAVSVTVPVFLIHRERVLQARDPASAAGTLRPLDIAGLVASLLVNVVYAGITLLGT